MELDNSSFFNLDSQDVKIPTDIKYISSMFLYGDTLYLGTRMSKLFIYQLDQKEGLMNQRMVVPHCETVSQVIANSRFFVTVPESDEENSVSIWDIRSHLFEASLKGHMAQVSRVMFTSDEKHIVTSSWDSNVRVWSFD